MEKMPVLEMQKAMVLDSTTSSTPLTLDVNKQDEILDNFGVITYAKGEYFSVCKLKEKQFELSVSLPLPFTNYSVRAKTMCKI